MTSRRVLPLGRWKDWVGVPLTPLSLTYAFILSFYLPKGVPLIFIPSTLLKYTLTNSSFPSFQYGQTISGCFFSPIPPHHTQPHFHALSCHTSPTHLHCSAHPIYSLHTLLSSSSSLQHALLIAVPHSMSSSPTHMLPLVRGYYSSEPSSRP